MFELLFFIKYKKNSINLKINAKKKLKKTIDKINKIR